MSHKTIVEIIPSYVSLSVGVWLVFEFKTSDPAGPWRVLGFFYRETCSRRSSMTLGAGKITIIVKITIVASAAVGSGFYQMGTDNGYKAGYAQGNTDGYNKGNADGHPQGPGRRVSARQTGRRDHRIQQRLLRGPGKGQAQGQAQGEQTGYNNGYNAGWNKA